MSEAGNADNPCRASRTLVSVHLITTDVCHTTASMGSFQKMAVATTMSTDTMAIGPRLNGWSQQQGQPGVWNDFFMLHIILKLILRIFLLPSSAPWNISATSYHWRALCLRIVFSLGFRCCSRPQAGPLLAAAGLGFVSWHREVWVWAAGTDWGEEIGSPCAAGSPPAASRGC